MKEASPPVTPTRIPKSYIIILTVLLGIYVVNCFTTFRLGNDVLRYFVLKERLEHQPNLPDIEDNLPLGFPVTLVLLSKLNLCKSVFICFLNLIYLSGSLYFTDRIFRDKYQRWILAVLVLLNWSIIKNVITPLSDMQYMFFLRGAYISWVSTGTAGRCGIFCYLSYWP